MAILIFLTSKPSLLVSNLNKELKLIFVITSSLWYLKQRDRKKEYYSAIVPHLFILQLYTEWQILIGFNYGSKPAGFRAISMTFLNFFRQQKYSGEFSYPVVV